MIYTTDEVAAVVLDAGSWTTRAGFAGEDSPKAVFSTYYGAQELPSETTTEKSSISSLTTSNGTADKDTNGSSSDSKNNNENNSESKKDADGDVDMTSSEGNDNQSQEKEKKDPKNEEQDNRAPQKDSNSNIASSNSRKKYKYFIGDNSVHVPRADIEIKSPMREGIVHDWDAMEQIWDHALNKTLGIDMSEHPYLITEQPWNTRENRRIAMELAFEKFKVPAFYIVKSPVASIFASGKGSGLVVDIGHTTVSVTPIIDGLPLYKPSRRSLYAGSFLADEVRHALETRYTSTYPHMSTAINTPRYLISSRRIPLELGAAAQVVLKKFPNSIVNGVPSASFRRFEIMSRVLEEFKQSMCQVSDTPFKPDEMATSIQSRVFEFPDGSNYPFAADRFSISESLFAPTNPQFAYDGFPIPSTAEKSEAKSDKEEKEDKENKKKEAYESTEAAVLPPAPSGPSSTPATGTTTGTETATNGNSNSTSSTSNGNASSASSAKKEGTDNKAQTSSSSTNATTSSSGTGTSNSAGSSGTGSAGGASTTTTQTGPPPTPSYMLNDVRPIPPFSRTLGLSELIVSSINACDVDIRPNLANNIVITGGSSLVQGLTDRVNQDLSHALAGLKIRLYAPGNLTERSYSAWVGGSILSSLGTFHQLWISKREYDEVGPEKLLDRRFR